VTASSLRALSAVAAAAALVVVIGDLALAWSRHHDPATRQAIAFDHGVAAAVVLALALAAGRIALALDGELDHPLADAVAIAGCIAVLGDMAAVWRDRGMSLDTLGALALHLSAVAAVFALRLLVVRVEGPRRRAHRPPIGTR
jgi:hypothetical protein